jgi:protein TonB
VAKPVASPTPSAVASSAPAAQDQHHQAISLEPVSQSQKLPLPPDAKPAFTSPSPAAFAGGAASAPAPARDAHEPHFPETTPASAPNPAEALFEKPAEAVASESHSSSVAPTSFTFGGSNVPAESSGGKKKILIAVAAVVVVAAGLYFAWTYYQGRNTQTGTFESRISGPVATPQATKPVSIPPKPLPTEPAPATPTSSSPSAKPAAQPNAEAAAPATSTAADDNDAPSENDAPAPTTSSKPSTSASTSGKAASSAKPAAAAPLVVKGGSAPAVHSKPAPSADAPAPSMIGIATTAASAPLPNLVNSTGSAPKPVLQTINISQGVSQGLLLKKVQPQYPRNALAMHVEGAVELMATISTTGNITAVKVVSGEQLLTKVAVDAVKQWKYKPYLLNGEPVEIQTQVTVNFKLPH